MGSNRKKPATKVKSGIRVIPGDGYHILRVSKGKEAPAGWIASSYYAMDSENIKAWMKRYQEKTLKKMPSMLLDYEPRWVLYPEPLGDPAWGVYSP